MENIIIQSRNILSIEKSPANAKGITSFTDLLLGVRETQNSLNPIITLSDSFYVTPYISSSKDETLLRGENYLGTAIYESVSFDFDIRQINSLTIKQVPFKENGLYYVDYELIFVPYSGDAITETITHNISFDISDIFTSTFSTNYIDNSIVYYDIGNTFIRFYEYDILEEQNNTLLSSVLSYQQEIEQLKIENANLENKVATGDAMNNTFELIKGATEPVYNFFSQNITNKITIGQVALIPFAVSIIVWLFRSLIK